MVLQKLLSVCTAVYLLRGEARRAVSGFMARGAGRDRPRGCGAVTAVMGVGVGLLGWGVEWSRWLDGGLRRGLGGGCNQQTK